jgi:AcrR family transcriptional regulator
MPRVSDDHLAARRQQILDAAWRCFARNGFHATSMQDVFTESGLSAGAVYRYFRSKSELIRATAESAFAMIDSLFDRLRATETLPPPAEAVRMMTEQVVHIAETGHTDRTRIALMVWAEALRDPAVDDLVQSVLPPVRDRISELAVRWQRQGTIDPSADPEEVAKVIYGVIVGFLVQRLIAGDVTPGSYAAAFGAILGPSLTEVAGGDA